MRDDMDVPEEVVWEGRFIAAKRRGKWEYVSRTRNISAAVILAVHEGEVYIRVNRDQVDHVRSGLGIVT